MSVAVIGLNAPSVFEADLPSVAYEEASSPDEAHRNLRKALEQSPIAMGARGPEILSYDLVHAALRDHRLCPPPGLGLEAQGITSGPLWYRTSTSLLAINGADHTRLRRLVSKAFTPRSVARLETTITDIINELIDPLMAAGRSEIVSDIARPYPVPVISALLGAPREDWLRFSNWADDFFKLFTWNVAEYERDILTAWAELDAYIDEMVADRRHSLTDDLISELIRAEHDGDRLSIEELRMLAAGILMAGTDTTRNQVAAAVDVFCDHPEQWDLLAEQPELAMKAVEEVMRYSPVVFAAMRIATEDVELADSPSRQALSSCATPPPPTATQASSTSRIASTSRARVPHRCRPSAQVRITAWARTSPRRELAEALRVMASRMRNLRHYGPSVWKPIVGITGPATLPVQFDAA